VVTCEIRRKTFLHPQHSRGKSTALKHFCKCLFCRCYILHITAVEEFKLLENAVWYKISSVTNRPIALQEADMDMSHADRKTTGVISNGAGALEL